MGQFDEDQNLKKVYLKDDEPLFISNVFLSPVPLLRDILYVIFGDSNYVASTSRDDEGFLLIFGVEFILFNLYSI